MKDTPLPKATYPTLLLSRFVAELSIDQIPANVAAKAKELFIDWLGSTLAGRGAHAIAGFEAFADIAVCGKAGLAEFDGHALTDQAVLSFPDRVEMRLDPEVNAACPRRWIGKVTVTTKDGRQLSGRVVEAKGDPGNPLTPAEVKDKAIRPPTHNGFSDFIQ